MTDPAAVLRDRGLNPPADLPAELLAEFARLVTTLWADGRAVPFADFRIDPADEGLLFGRGAWESTRTVGGAPWLWPLHLDRLRQTCDLLAVPLAPGRLPSADTVAGFVRSLTSQDVVLRLNVTAGRPGHDGVVWMTAAPIPAVPKSLKLRSVRNPVRKGQASLTLKTFQYANRLRVGQQAADAGFDSALLLDDADHLQEASHANIFLRLPDGWVTPAADGGFLPGTVRHHLLQSQPLPIRETAVPYSDVARATEAFVSASNVGLVPVTMIDGHQMPVGDDTRRLAAWAIPPGAGLQWRFVGNGQMRR